MAKCSRRAVSVPSSWKNISHTSFPSVMTCIRNPPTACVLKSATSLPDAQRTTFFLRRAEAFLPFLVAPGPSTMSCFSEVDFKFFFRAILPELTKSKMCEHSQLRSLNLLLLPCKCNPGLLLRQSACFKQQLCQKSGTRPTC